MLIYHEPPAIVRSAALHRRAIPRAVITTGILYGEPAPGSRHGGLLRVMFGQMASAYNPPTAGTESATVSREYSGTETAPTNSATLPPLACSQILANMESDGQTAGESCSCPPGAAQPQCSAVDAAQVCENYLATEKIPDTESCVCTSGGITPVCTSYYDLCENDLSIVQASEPYDVCSCTNPQTVATPDCVPNNAYVANGYGYLSIGYTTLNLYNAVYTTQGGWSGQIGVMIGGGAATSNAYINAAFLNTPASSGTVTISVNETAINPSGLSVLAAPGSIFNTQYETPAQIAAGGYGEVLSVIMNASGLSLVGYNSNGTTYPRELYDGPTVGPTTANLYFNNSGFYLFEQNPGACANIYTGAAASGNLFVSGSPTTGATILGGQGCNAVVGGGCIPGPSGQCTNNYQAVVAYLTTDICTGTDATTHPAAGTSACTTLVDNAAGPESNYT